MPLQSYTIQKTQFCKYSNIRKPVKGYDTDYFSSDDCLSDSDSDSDS